MQRAAHEQLGYPPQPAAGLQYLGVRAKLQGKKDRGEPLSPEEENILAGANTLVTGEGKVRAEDPDNPMSVFNLKGSSIAPSAPASAPAAPVAAPKAAAPKPVATVKWGRDKDGNPVQLSQ